MLRINEMNFSSFQMPDCLHSGKTWRGSPASSRAPSEGSTSSRCSSPEPAPDEPCRHRAWASLIAVVAAAVYLTSIPGDMVYDDVIAVKENRDIRPHSPILNIFRNDFWGTPIHKVGSNELLHTSQACIRFSLEETSSLGRLSSPDSCRIALSDGVGMSN